MEILPHTFAKKNHAIHLGKCFLRPTWNGIQMMVWKMMFKKYLCSNMAISGDIWDPHFDSWDIYINF